MLLGTVQELGFRAGGDKEPHISPVSKDTSLQRAPFQIPCQFEGEVGFVLELGVCGLGFRKGLGNLF